MSVPERPTDPSALDASASRLPLTDNPLFLAGQQDFIDALTIADTISDTHYLMDARVAISLEQVRAGQAPAFPPEYFADFVQGEPTTRMGDILEKVAEMQARAGDLEGSERTMPFKSPGMDIDARISIVHAHAAQGRQVQPFFDYLYSRNGLITRADSDDIVKIATTEQELTGTTSTSTVIGAYLAEAAEIHTPFNLPEEHYLPDLAVTYARLGQPEEALAAWERGEHENDRKRTEDFSRIVLSHAKAGKDISDLTKSAAELAEGIDNSGEFSYHELQVKIYGRLAQSQALVRQDSQPFIDRALEHADEAPENYHHLIARSLMKVARAQVASGLDAQPTFAKALLLVDSEDMLAADGDANMYDIVDYLMSLEDVFNAQVELGFYDEARETAERLDQIVTKDPGWIVEKVSWLAKLGGARMRAAMAS